MRKIEARSLADLVTMTARLRLGPLDATARPGVAAAGNDSPHALVAGH